MLFGERLREEAGRRPEIVVVVGTVVRVELQLVVVEVEIGRLGEDAIAVG